MITTRGFFRIFLLATGIFMLASPGMARPVQKQADAPVQMLLPIVIKKFTFGNGTVTGSVINASLGSDVPGAQVCWGSNCVYSNGGGEYTLENVANGYQTLTASKDGFVTADQVAYVVGNTINYQNIAIIPDLYLSGLKYRILTTWSTTECWPDPNGVTCWDNDLDVHMWIEPPPLNYHIGYYFHYNPLTELEEDWLDFGDCYGLFPNACLEKDTRRGYGPETMAIKQLEYQKIYYFGVRNYNQNQPGVPPISQTGARVRLYDLTGLAGSYEVPNNMGDLGFWYVFKLDNTVDPPLITEENCIIDYSDNPPQCP
jgi:hypothetical protein